MNVLFVTSELAGWVKTGGLGDVSAALPAALRGLGIDVRVLLPGYRPLLAQIGHRPAVATLAPWRGLHGARLLDARTPHGVPAWVLDCPGYYDRATGPYLDEDDRDFIDNAQRFALLGWAAAQLAAGCAPGWRPDVMHGHDWQAGLAPVYVRRVLDLTVGCVQTVHNLAFQGLFPGGLIEALGLPREGFTPQGYEYYSRISFLKAALCEADAITTVSPTYAREICRAPLGFGLEGVLAARGDALTGILNGIDTQAWNPQTDAYITRRYGPDTLDDKLDNKRALQRAYGLARVDDAPLLGVVSRLTEQKGIDLIITAAPRLLALGVQLAVLGEGERKLEQVLTGLAAAHPGRIAVRIGFDEPAAHAIESGADIFLMPSRFEPCGLNQMYSQRYGTPPIVRRTGGLADTVVDCNPQTLPAGTATGFVFEGEDAGALVHAVVRALEILRDAPRWRRLQVNGMQREFGWGGAARRYAELYRRVVGTRR